VSLVLNEDQQMLQDSARQFCREVSPVGVLRKLRDSRDEAAFDPDIWQKMIELGWAGMAIPEAYGGFEFGYGGLGVVLEETGRTLVSSPLIGTVLLGATAINELGSEAQKTELLPKIIGGELLLALALDEHAIHAPDNIQTTAVLDNDEYVINGSKTFVLDGTIANKIIVVANTGEGQIALFLVDADSAGVDIKRTWMVDSRNAAKISFNEVKTSKDNLLGELDGFSSLDKVLDIARIGLAAEMLGSMQETFDRIIDYLKQREQFGILIGSFQGLQHRAAEMYSEIELCRSVVRAAFTALDDPSTTAEQLSAAASLAKAKLSEVTERVSNEGIQMHGGIGMTDEFDIGFFIKRARVAQQTLGDAGFHRDRFAVLNKF